MTNLSDLATARASAMAAVEYLTGLHPGGDKQEQEAHHAALRIAKEAYREAEAAYARATATLTADEIAALTAAGKRAAA